MMEHEISSLLIAQKKRKQKIKNKLSWKMEYIARRGQASKLCFNTNRKIFSTLIALMSEIVIVFLFLPGYKYSA